MTKTGVTVAVAHRYLAARMADGGWRDDTTVAFNGTRALLVDGQARLKALEAMNALPTGRTE